MVVGENVAFPGHDKTAARPENDERLACLAEPREQFSEAEIVELGMMIGQYVSFGRLLVMLDIGKGACEIYNPEY